MKKTTPLFPGFHLQTLRRTPKSAQHKLADELVRFREKSFSQIGTCFKSYIPNHFLLPEKTGEMSRRRLYSKENTFWAFLSQALDSDGGCKEVVRRLQAYASLKSESLPSSSTAAYCKARQRLNGADLSNILEFTAKKGVVKATSPSFHNRRVIVVDGTGVSMADTAANRSVWPLQSHQKPGCGFPTARICACFSLDTGMLLSYKVGNKKSSELPLFRSQWGIFKKGDIFLADKGFCNYFDIAKLNEKGVDSVVTLKKRKPVKDSDAVKKLGCNDLLIKWKKPVWQKKAAYSKAEWETLPDELLLRQVKVKVPIPGFRTQEFYIITTLLDAKTYSPESLAELYFKRWDVELFLRDIKTTMGMDVLRCKTPNMIYKEITMHFIAYNCIRHLMCDASTQTDIEVRRISFKGSLQALRQWEPHLNQNNRRSRKRTRLIYLLYESIVSNLIPHRPGRSEPRCLKRRPKPYQLLTAPRHEMKEIKHRSKYRASTP
jgi:hypothetical protein